MASRFDGAARASSYDDKWQQMAAAGENPHGEVDFVMGYEPASVLDAGCGTGRVAIELARRGIEAVGTDIDAAMLAKATDKAPHLRWELSDLAALDLDRTFDLVVMAGNIVLFVEPGTEAKVVAGAARHVGSGGHLVAGFSLGHGVTVDAWEGWLVDADMAVVDRFSTWSGEAWTPSSNYLVSVSKRR